MDLQQERILVTGAGGFLGKHVLTELHAAGVLGPKLLLPSRLTYDVTRESAVELMYARLRPTVVIHLAAEVGGIGANQANPGRFFYANMAMGLHMIEHARQAGVKKFVMVGTTCSYPKDAPLPFCEDDLWNGYPEETNASYGVAKRALLAMLHAYRDQYGLKGVYLLPANLYGPGDNFNAETSHVIPAMIRKFVAAKAQGNDSVSLWGTGEASREFLYVEDCARAIVLAAQRYDERAPVNIGTGHEITIRSLAEKIARMVGYEGQIVWDDARPNGQPRRGLDIERAEEVFGFAAGVNLGEGLARTLEWFCRERAASRMLS